MNTMDEYLRNIVRDFEHCDCCGECKASEKINGTDCTFCQLLMIYKRDISRALNTLMDKM